MSRPKHQPSSARVLTQWVDAYAREHGLPPKRVRDWISYMILGGRLERSRTAEVPHFAIKGAVAIEMRLPQKARATRDIDLVVDLVDGDLTAALRHAVEGDYQGFAFRVKGEPHVMLHVHLPGPDSEQAILVEHGSAGRLRRRRRGGIRNRPLRCRSRVDGKP